MNNPIQVNNPEGLQSATFGEGCFWCVETLFAQLAGVERVESGYSGGHIKNPCYREICAKTTGHAEVIRIYFDPKLISYEDLLEVFWKTHDPTTPNQQGNDIGPQYRSAIFYHDEHQKDLAEKSKQAATEARLYPNPIVTEISPLINYYKAEDSHQDYYNQNTEQRYCSLVITPKVDKFRKIFSHKLKK